MTENQKRNTPNRRREAEMYRVEAIQDEMASAVRFLGGTGPAKEQNNKAAREARLPVTTIERLRWRKIKRVPADIADAIREALHRHNEESLARAQHELTVERAKSAALLSYFEASDPDFYRPEIDRLRRSFAGDGRGHDQEGGG